MNNFLFGNSSFSYYETICGGTGAGPGFNGSDGVHQHMTNTRITDAEILEFRYPVRLDHFQIRDGSGGQGLWNGGNGVRRKFTFLQDLELTLLMQHRVEAPYGSEGGNSGKTGIHTHIDQHGIRAELKGIDALTVRKGESIEIQTPGGGGWGSI